METVRNLVRSVMRHVARVINRVSLGYVTPNMVTFVGLLAHVPIALFIAKGYFGRAVILLIIFGLFDTLDGELARLQKRASSAGMLLDAVTDRMKEAFLYAGIAFYFVERYTQTTEQLYYPQLLELEDLIVVTVLAATGSMLVSYVKAKGETALAGGSLTANEVNRLFQDGFLRFEVRMTILIIGMLLGMAGLVLAVFAIALLAWMTAIWRLINISRKLT